MDVLIKEKLTDTVVPSQQLGRYFLPERRIIRLLVEKFGMEFTISYISDSPELSGPETLIFVGNFEDASQKVINIGGGKGLSIEQALGELHNLSEESIKRRVKERTNHWTSW